MARLATTILVFVFRKADRTVFHFAAKQRSG
jgi:hypothetical protein